MLDLIRVPGKISLKADNKDLNNASRFWYFLEEMTGLSSELLDLLSGAERPAVGGRRVKAKTQTKCSKTVLRNPLFPCLSNHTKIPGKWVHRWGVLPCREGSCPGAVEKGSGRKLSGGRVKGVRRTEACPSPERRARCACGGGCVS